MLVYIMYNVGIPSFRCELSCGELSGVTSHFLVEALYYIILYYCHSLMSLFSGSSNNVQRHVNVTFCLFSECMYSILIN